MNDSPRDRLLDGLTEAQKDVVLQRGRGPIKVAAAAGSGKTTTMAALYAAAVLEGTAPQHILAVTFTERGAAELRQRIVATLERLLPASNQADLEGLEGSWIGTFHHFARRLLREHSYEAGVPRDLRVLDEVEARLQLEAAVRLVRDSLPRDSLVQRMVGEDGSPRELLKLMTDAPGAVSRLRSTAKTITDCRRESESAYERFLAMGDPESEVRWHRLALHLTLTVWQRYETALGQQRLIDFDGLLRSALTAIGTSERLSAWCRENFQMVIVDEFQDTSAIQGALLDALVGDHLERLFVVGDSRQSIFAFRDARPEAMHAAPGRSFRLFRNYRSWRPILTAADHVIRADQRFHEDKPMEVGRDDYPGHAVLLGAATSVDEEAEGIAAAIEALHQFGVPGEKGVQHPVGYEDIAVLSYTFSKLGRPLEDALRRRQIPFQTATGQLLERPEVKDALALLRVVADPDDDQAWVRVLQSSWVRVSDAQMLRLSRSTGPGGGPLILRVRANLPSAGIPPPLRERLAEVFMVVKRLRELASHRPASEVVMAAVRWSGLGEFHAVRFAGEHVDGKRSQAALRELQRLAVGTQASSRWVGLPEFLTRVGAMVEHGGQAEPVTRDDQGKVTVSTIHRAKGMEWPIVILADCRPHHARGSAAILWDHSQNAVVVPRVGGKDTRAGARWKRLPLAQVPVEEHRRLVYVAMTRARDLLLITTTRPGSKVSGATLDELLEELPGRDLGRGEYAELVTAMVQEEVDWLRPLSGFPHRVALPWQSQPTRSLRATEGGTARAATPRLGIEGIVDLEQQAARTTSGRPRVRQVSFSALQTLDDCPRQFWFTYLAGFSSGADEGATIVPDLAGPKSGSGLRSRGRALRLGALLHGVLEQAHRNPARPPTPGDLEEMLEQLAGHGDIEEADEARAMLRSYARTYVMGLPTLGVEVPFRWRDWSGVGLPVLTGVIDRIAVAPDGARLVLDYKTNHTMSPVEAEHYSHQLRLYAMALEAAHDDGTVPLRAALVMLRTGDVVEVDCSPQAKLATIAWASSLASGLTGDAPLSGLSHPQRPCSKCQFQPLCPERRAAPAVTPGFSDALGLGRV